MAAACGGFNHISFLENGEIAVQPVILRPERLAELTSHLMLFYTGIKRTASDVARTFVEDLGARRRQLRILNDLVQEALTVLNSGRDIREFGELLHEAWLAKSSLSAAVTNRAVDDLYAKARDAGAIGGKLTGAGGGGFMLLFVPPAEQERVRAAFGNLIHVPFGFEFLGSQIIFYDKEADYASSRQIRAGQRIGVFQELAECLA